MQFATCNRKSALEYIQKVLPDKDISDTEESIKGLLDLVEKDVIRVQDPMMHGNKIGILPSDNWNESHRETIMKYHSKLT